MEENVESEIKLTPSEQLQAKIAAEGLGEDEILAQVQDALSFGAFEVTERSVEEIEDEYFDTEDLALNACHAAVRIRRTGDEYEMTAKTLLGSSPGLLNRTESEIKGLSVERANVLRKTGFRDVVQRVFPDLPRGTTLAPVVVVRNTRHNFFVDRGGGKFVFSVDRYRFVGADRTSSEMFEVEIEAKNEEARKLLPSLRTSLRGAMKFKYSDGSKYERALRFARVSTDVEAATDPVADPVPESLSGAVLADVSKLPRVWRRTLIYGALFVVTVSTAAYAVWASLPDNVKEGILNRVVGRGTGAADVPAGKEP